MLSATQIFVRPETDLVIEEIIYIFVNLMAPNGTKLPRLERSLAKRFEPRNTLFCLVSFLMEFPGKGVSVGHVFVSN